MPWPWAQVWALGFKMPLKALLSGWHLVDILITGPFPWLGLKASFGFGGQWKSWRKGTAPHTHPARAPLLPALLSALPPQGFGLTATCKEPPLTTITHPDRDLRWGGTGLIPKSQWHTPFTSITALFMKTEKPNCLYNFQPITTAVSQNLTPKTLNPFTWESILDIVVGAAVR